MNGQQLLATVLRNAFTKPDALRLIRVYRGYLEEQFYSSKKKSSLKEYLQREKTAQPDAEAILSWGEEVYTAFTKENAYDLFAAVGEALKTVPVVGVYLPFEPDQTEIGRIGAWFRNNVHALILIEIHQDESLVGGCAVTWKGIFQDYSLRHYMHKERSAIQDAVSRYVKTK